MGLRWVLICCLWCAAPLAAQPVSQAGAWAVHQTTGASVTCYAERTFEDGSIVRIGFDPDQEGGFFAVYNPAWTHIEEGRKGLIQFDFGQEKFAGEAFGRYQDGVPGGYAFFNNPAFAEAFARRQNVVVSGSNGVEYQLDLTGTSRAATAVRDCQRARAKSTGAD